MTYKWLKSGLVFKPAEIHGRPWLNTFAQAPATLIFDDFVRVYFSCRPPADANGQYVSYTSFVDLHRKDLTCIKAVAEDPILELGAKGCFDEFGVYPTSVIRDEKAVRAYFGGWTRCESVPFNVAIGCATSNDDGITFKRLGPGPIIPYSPDEPFIMSGPKIRRFNDQWYLYYIAGKKWIMHDGRAEPVYRIRLALSDDGLTWHKINKDLIQQKIEDDECQACPDVIYINGKYHMFFCYRYSRDYRSKQKGYRIGYATSENGIDWQRNDARAGIDVSQSGWDEQMVSYPHVFELDGKIHMFYLGNDVGRDGFGLATLEGGLL